jgi:hypothetical protein
MATLALTLRKTNDRKSNSAGGDTGSNDTSLQEVDYSVLKYTQLQVSCNTWTREQTSESNASRRKQKKVHTSLAKVWMLTSRFPKFNQV